MKELTFLSLFSGCGGFDLGLERAGFKCKGQIEIMPYALKVLKKHWPEVPKHTDISTFCAQDGLAKAIQSQVNARVCRTKEADSGERWQDVLDYLSRNGFLEKMFLGFYPLMTAKTLQKLPTSCKKSGMAYRGEYLTVNTSESPNDAKECSLSDILAESVHPKYYLSRKAVEGMIRRSRKWGRGGYVFLQEKGNAGTPQLKLLSLNQLLQLLSEPRKQEIECVDSSLNACQPTISQEALQPQEGKETSSHKQSTQEKEDALAGYGKTLMLRKLTPEEKEQLQGFPPNFTVVSEE